MCFSAGASFGAGTILLAIGYAAASQAKTKQQHILCVIPLLFSLQQFIEGLLWLSLKHDVYAGWRQLLLYLFLIAAQVVWPLFVPLCALLLEEAPLRKRILAVFSIIGLLTSLSFLYGLVFYSAGVSISHHHISYTLEFPLLQQWYGGIPYLAAAVVGPLFSSDRVIRWIGVLLLISYLAARLFYKDHVISVWCYFATVISLAALYDIVLRNRTR